MFLEFIQNTVYQDNNNPLRDFILPCQCNAIISEYGEAILDLIAGSDPHTLCEVSNSFSC